MSDKYNQLFATLVEQHPIGSASQLIGKLAYAEYKVEKRAFIIDFQALHDRAPNQEELDNFLIIYNTAKIDDLIYDAENTLVEFAEALLEDTLKEATQGIIEESIIEEVDSKLAEFKRHATWWKAVAIGAVSSLAASFLIAVIVAVVSVANPNSTWSKVIKALYDDSVQVQLIESKPHQ